MPRRTARSPSPRQPRRSSVRAARFELTLTLKTHMKEASDVVALPGGGFVVVGDTSDRVTVLDAAGRRKAVKLPGLPKGNSELEGVAYDPLRHRLFVVREEKSQLLRYKWNPAKREAPRLEKTFAVERSGPRNKGIEGIVYLPAQLSPTGQPQLLLAKEGKPRELWLHDDGGRQTGRQVALEKDVYAACRDFSAVAVDPKTGDLFISSDESAACAQVRLARRRGTVAGRLLRAFPLRDEKGKALSRVEGLTFDEHGDLFVLTENDGKLRRLARVGG